MNTEIETGEVIEKPKAIILYDKKAKKESLVDEKKFRVATKGTAEDISRLLNYDYIEYNGIKPAIYEDRAIEIETAQRLLQQTQRDFDTLCTVNAQLEREYAKISDAVSSFEVIKEAAESTCLFGSKQQDDLEADVAHIYDLLEQERRRIFVLEHMKVRTRDDIVDIKAVHSNLVGNIDKNKSELAILMATLRSMTLDIKMQERQYEEMLVEIESRQAQRDEQLQSIKYMVNEGRRSIQTIQEMSPAGAHLLESLNMSLVPHSPSRTQRSFPSRINTSKSSRRLKESSKALTETHLGGTSDINLIALSSLESQNAYLDSQLEEEINWRESLEYRRKQLAERQAEVQTRRQFEGQMSRYDEEMEKLSMEMQSLVARDVQLKEGLDNMFQAVPRLLAKLTHRACEPCETLEELEESVNSLEHELSKTLLNLNTSLVSCAAITEGDEEEEEDDDEEENNKDEREGDEMSTSRSMSSRSASRTRERLSEMAKLMQHINSQQGVELQSRLFKALMSASPNDTARNVRVVSMNKRIRSRREDVNANASATASTFRFKKSQSMLGSHSKISSYRRFSRGSSSMLTNFADRDSDDEDEVAEGEGESCKFRTGAGKTGEPTQDNIEVDRPPTLITTTLSFDRKTMKAISDLVVSQHMRPKRAVKIPRNLNLKKTGQRAVANDDTIKNDDKNVDESTNNITSGVL